MQETIILSNINDRELLKSFALNGKNTFNLRIFNSVELAKEALIRSGKIISLRQITSIEQECFIFNLLSSIQYFKNSSYEDAKNIASSLNYARKLCRGDEEIKIASVLSKVEFKEKNDALLTLYKEYKKYLKEKNLTDTIEIINYAINNAKPIDADFIVFKETPIEPVEEELIKVISNSKYEVKTIRECLKLKDKKLNNITYDNAYGSINEVEHILGYIANNNIKYDDCVVALLDSSYSRHFLNYRDVFNVPVAFGIGQDINLSNSFKVLNLLDRWNKQYNAINSLNDLMNAPEFDTNKLWAVISNKELDNRNKSEIIKTIGNLKLSVYKNDKLSNYQGSLTDDKEINRFPYVEKFAEELQKGYSYIIKTYTKIENEALENRAINTICTYIDDYFANLPNKNIEKDLPQQLDDIISNLSSKKIIRESSKPGYLYLTDLNGALSCIRKHVFICGLNAKVFPGSPTEDYLLLDSDLERFEEKEAKDSNKKIQLNKQLLFNVVDNASAFDCSIHLSYSGYSLADLKEENPSSMLFEIFKKEKGESATTDDLKEALGKQHRYFEENISSLKEIGNKYLEGYITSSNISIEDDNTSKSIVDNAISPSAADIFFTCPRRFYLSKILKLVEPEDDNPFKTLPANDEGSLVHSCMEDYGNNPNWTKEEFMANAETKFEDYFNKRIPLHTKDKETLRKEYLRMAENGYNLDPKDKTVIASEKYLGPYKDPITGLNFGGIVDRIEKLPNGKYKIVDYKTYKEKQNETGDIDSCFQVVLYAYILENCNNKDNIEVEDCEYRYLRNPMNIEVGYKDLKEQLKDKLVEIKTALDSGNFPYTSDPEKDCTYCKLKDVCGINKKVL